MECISSDYFCSVNFWKNKPSKLAVLHAVFDEISYVREPFSIIIKLCCC